MAKLTAPLLSLGASGQIAKTLVFFDWKGLNVVRKYVVPTNPNTTDQQTQRGYIRTAVALIRARVGDTVHPTTQADQTAWALFASTFATPRTWFNALCKQIVDQLRDSLSQYYPMDGTSTPGDTTLALSIWERFGDTTAGYFWYGTSKTSLIFSKVAVVAVTEATATLTALTNGTKYYWQFRPTVPAAMVGGNSGIYHGTPSA